MTHRFDRLNSKPSSRMAINKDKLTDTPVFIDETRINACVPSDLLHSLKQLALDQKSTIKQLLNEAINDVLLKYNQK